MTHEPAEGQSRRWIWIFGEVAGLRWVVDNQQMAFPPASRARARRIRAGDRAVLYTSRGAFHNPTRDEARLAGLATVTGACKLSEEIEIAGREFTWACPITVDVLLPERQGPSVRALAPSFTSSSAPKRGVATSAARRSRSASKTGAC